jgi:hypothetical protein
VDYDWWRETGLRELRQILYWTWDPIGVNDAFPRTESEYDEYALQIGRHLLTGAAGEAEIAAYLMGTFGESMGLRVDHAATAAVARRIVEWHRESQDHWRDLRARSLAPKR